MVADRRIRLGLFPFLMIFHSITDQFQLANNKLTRIKFGLKLLFQSGLVML